MNHTETAQCSGGDAECLSYNCPDKETCMDVCKLCGNCVGFTYSEKATGDAVKCKMIAAAGQPDIVAPGSLPLSEVNLAYNRA